MTAEEEKRAFEWFVDSVMTRWSEYPAMHIYHFTPYEPSALKRLMGRHSTREDEIDRMLRAGLFIDLHTVLKRALRASVEQYSLKALEEFHAFRRAMPLEASAHRNASNGTRPGTGAAGRKRVKASRRRSLSTTLTIVFQLDPCATGWSRNARHWSKQGTASPVRQCQMALLPKRLANASDRLRRWQRH